MGMTRKAKEEMVASLADKVSRAKAGVIVDYSGLNVAAVTKIRNTFREADVEYRVVKNTLMKRVIAGTPLEGLSSQFRGPVAIAFKYDEEYGALGKAAKSASKDYEAFEFKAGFIEEEIIEGAAGLETMASLPTMDEARSQLLAVFNAPAAKLLAQINAPAAQLLAVFEAKIEKDKGE